MSPVSTRPPVARLTANRAVPASLAIGLALGVAVASSVEQFTNVYSTAASRAQIAATVGDNAAVRALFGAGRDLPTVPGWVAWRSLGIATIVGPLCGLLLATRLLRREEDSGRWDRVVAGPTSPRRATAAALAALAAGLVAAGIVVAAVTMVAGQVPDPAIGPGAALFFAGALIAPAAVFVAVGALASQLGGTRRQASQMAAVVYGAAFVARALGNADVGWSWTLWLSPLGWAQRLRPLTGSDPGPLVPIAILVAGLGALTVWLAGTRDVGAGLLASPERATARTRLLGGPLGLAVRLERGTWAAWAAAVAALAGFFGMVAVAAAEASSDSLDRVLARLGVTAGTEGYLGVFFVLLGAVLAFAAAGQAAAIGDEETDGHAQALLAAPVGRAAWMAGRLGASAAALACMAAVAGGAAWAGAASQGAPVGLARMVAAGLNCLPAAFAVLGVGALAHGAAPRRLRLVVYGLVGWSFAVTLLSVAGGVGVVGDLSLFEHVGPMPAGPFRPLAAAALVGAAAVATVAGTVLFHRRDISTP